MFPYMAFGSFLSQTLELRLLPAVLVKVNTVACFANFLMFIVHVSFFMYCVSGLLLPALLFEDGKLVTHNKKRPKICKG